MVIAYNMAPLSWQLMRRMKYQPWVALPNILLRNFAQIGMPMEEYEKAGNLQVICRYPEAMSLEDLLVGFRQHLEEFEPSLIVLDLTEFFGGLLAA